MHVKKGIVVKVAGIKNLTTGCRKKGLHQVTTGSNLGSIATNNCVSFKGGVNFAKRFWMRFRNLSDGMKEASEMTNAIIAMIGTGIIAPFAIMYSPKKKCPHANMQNSESTHKNDREKKVFQALRQPVSALLAFAFQVPSTIGIAYGFNKLAYQKHVKFFRDEVLGHLIPNKKYLKEEAAKVLKNGSNHKLAENWKQELELVKDRDALKTEFIDKIRQDYQEVGIKISDAELEEIANSKKKMGNFLAEKMANAKHDRLLGEKVQELATKRIDIKDLDIVTEDYQNLAKLKYKKDIAALRKDAKLSWFDKFIQSIGLSNKKLTQLSDAEKALTKEKGLELMKQDMPAVFTDKMTRLRKFVENTNIKAQKLYANKVFWLTLATNIVMVGISCVALNWLHPKFANVIDKIRGKKPDDVTSTQKVEVKS